MELVILKTQGTLITLVNIARAQIVTKDGCEIPPMILAGLQR